MAVSLGIDIYGFDKSCLICLPMVSGCVLVKRLLVIRLEPVRLSLLHAELLWLCRSKEKAVSENGFHFHSLPFCLLSV